MAKLPSDIIITVKVRIDISLWDVLKLRLSGAGLELKKYIQMKIAEAEK